MADPRSSENLARECVQVSGLVKLTRATMEGCSYGLLKAIAECDDLTTRERNAVERLIAERPMREYVSGGGIGPAPAAR